MSKVNVYQQVTDRIIAGLEQKGLQWFKPWNDGGAGFSLAINNATGKPYKGINQLLLSIALGDGKYTNNEWLTFKQASGKGGKVKKGEKSTAVVFWNISYKDVETGKFYKTPDAAPDPKRLEKVFSPRLWNVFNIEQCEDIEPRRKPVQPVEGSEFNPIESAERIYAEQYPKDKRPTLGHGGVSAFYSPSKHHVQMPKPETFISPDDYYKTLFHELTHSTGHKSILKRLDKVAAFGGDAYSKEELVAEIGSEFLVGITGIQPKDNEKNSQAYINGWIQKLKEQPKLALSAANKAMQAVDFIIGEGA